MWEDKHVDLLLIGEGEKKHYILIKDFDIIKIVGENIFVVIVCKLLTAETLNCCSKDCFKINSKQKCNKFNKPFKSYLVEDAV